MSWYSVLGVDQSADETELRRAFRAKARETHPDMGGSSEAFMLLKTAFDGLMNPLQRAQHDEELAGAQPRTPVLNAPPRRFARQDGWKLDGERGGEISSEVMIDQRTAVFGGKAQLRRNRLEPCDECLGSGATTSGSTCPRCSGDGRIVHFVVHEIVVPQRTKNGDEQRLIGLGDAGERRRDSVGHPLSGCGPCGTIVVKFSVLTGGVVSERGDDLVRSVVISSYDALLGAQVAVELLDGVYNLSVPAGVQPGQRLRISGRGAPRRGREGRGDFVVEVLVETLTDLDSYERETLEKLRDRRERLGAQRLSSERRS